MLQYYAFNWEFIRSLCILVLQIKDLKKKAVYKVTKIYPQFGQ